MADDGNEDSWLYGSGEPRPDGEESTTDAAGAASKSADDESNSATDAPAPTAAAAAGPQQTNENGKADEGAGGADAAATTTASGDKESMDTVEETVPNPADEMEEADREEGERVSGEENSESEEDDDDINVVIGDIKSGPNYNIKNRGNLAAAGSTTTPAAGDKAGKQAAGGKFNIEEFESVGIINGVPAHEFSIDSLDEKPWRKPGADITDYFNYGFNEDTWRMYCERQKRMRQNESGVGLQGLMVAPVMIPTHTNPIDRSAGPGGRTLTPIANDNSKYGALTALPVNRRAGPPPGRRMTGAIDVIGGNGMGPGGGPDGRPMIKHENAIQVMTAERREYSRPGGMGGGGAKFDMPPPGFPGPGGGPPGPDRSMGGGGGGPGGPGPGGPGGPIMVDPFFEPDAFSYGYEPTQDSQWGPAHNNPGWAPTGIKELTPGPPQMVPPPGSGPGMPGMGMPGGMPIQGVPPPGGPPSRYPPPNSSGGSAEQQQRSDRDRSMRGERSGEARDRERDRGERERSVVDKERRSRTEREGSRRRERSRSRERSRRRSRSREKERTDRDRSSRDEKRKSSGKKDD